MARRRNGIIKSSAGDASAAVDEAVHKAGEAIKKVPGPSPNPMTNLILADVALRGGGRLMRRSLERLLLGAKYSPGKAREIVKGRSMTQMLFGAVIARVATGSVPGAIVVGGGMVAKTLYDRSNARRARSEGEAQVEEQASNA